MPSKGHKDAVKALLEFLEKHFGMPEEIFEKYTIYEHKKGEFWISTPEALELEFPVPARYGFRFANAMKKGFRLSTAAIQLFGHAATRNTVELSEEEMKLFLAGKNIPNRWGKDFKGQIIVKYRGIPLGSAVLEGDHLKNQIPRARRILGEVS